MLYFVKDQSVMVMRASEHTERLNTLVLYNTLAWIPLVPLASEEANPIRGFELATIESRRIRGQR